MGTRDITHEALAKALSEGTPLTDEQRAVLLGAVADDEAWQREVDRLLAENARLRACLDQWRHDGRLQTYDDRERFRADAGALLLPNVPVTRGRRPSR